MKTFRLQLRFFLPMVLAIVAFGYATRPLTERLAFQWFARDLQAQARLMASALADSIGESVDSGRPARLQQLFDGAQRDERLFGMLLCGADGRSLQRSEGLPKSLDCRAAKAAAGKREPVIELPRGRAYVTWNEVRGDGSALGELVLLHDMRFVEERTRDAREALLMVIAVLGASLALITAVVAQLSWRSWVSGALALLRGEGVMRPASSAPELAPLAAELRTRLRDLEDEFRRVQGPQVEWDAQRLRALLKTQLSGDQVIVVSNREPYIHEHADGRIIVKRPASGLVTAVEPVMRACSGTWVAHGSGDADREVVDSHDRVRVPPGHDDYALRRIWLRPEEEQGYYYGFANEGLWPLCHVAHVRPVFRESDWQRYMEVNRRFADAVVEEARVEDPVILAQDYHFALLPAYVRERLPRATILTFWHIPWPNPESFGICPWRREILRGLLGSTIVGFHTRYHCKNFLETVDRYLEARIEHEHSTVTIGGDETLVESYPISIAWPRPEVSAQWPSVAECRRELLEAYELPDDQAFAVGVDRFDYTKGILERLHAVERLLEKHPEWVGRFTFVQVAAPSRSSLEEYRVFQQRIDSVVQRINDRFGKNGRPPVRLIAEHREPEQITRLFRAADVCLVTSLHDGMNLVCKEFVAARDDERGVLILSRFAGAARELSEALIVNPYHVEETADAIHQALTMPPAEQRERMAAMRMTVREFNVYRWAARMLADAGRFRAHQRIEARVLSHQPNGSSNDHSNGA
ncbi:alpha,alpha-trehalose-phosphate synthase (UDP-forming) [Caldimonas sp. KR1-144]|uniref:alpha,alpha-trehalose-phosphate synthase (UDP-forming) n=1 Tax=Caldimonas sp. KR1-144 TaxID=3400911 RepID=UPI003BFEADDB